MGRVLALDWGAKRHGLAVSDALGVGARGLETLERPATRAEEWERIDAVIAEHEVDRLVVGLPFHMDGAPGTHQRDILRWARALRDHTGLPLVLVDERLTTVEAEEHLKRLHPRDHRKRKARVDAVAAAVILQGYLDHPGSATTLEDVEGGGPG